MAQEKEIQYKHLSGPQGNARRRPDRQPQADAAGRTCAPDRGGQYTRGCPSVTEEKILQKIEQIVREEQDRAGAIEMLMPTLQSADLWRESGRYEAYGPNAAHPRPARARECLWSDDEEMITAIFATEAKSYRDLPRTLYHIQWKFRDKVRPRVRRDARPRVPDEGRLQLRPRRGWARGRAITTQMLGLPSRSSSGSGSAAMPMKAATRTNQQ